MHSSLLEESPPPKDVILEGTEEGAELGLELVSCSEASGSSTAGPSGGILIGGLSFDVELPFGVSLVGVADVGNEDGL